MKKSTKRVRVIILTWVIVFCIIGLLLFLILRNREPSDNKITTSNPSESVAINIDTDKNETPTEGELINNTTNNNEHYSVEELENIGNIIITNNKIVSEYNQDEVIKKICWDYSSDVKEIIIKNKDGNKIYASLIYNDGTVEEVVLIYQSLYNKFTNVQTIDEYNYSLGCGGGPEEKENTVTNTEENVTETPSNIMMNSETWANSISGKITEKEIDISDIKNIEIYYKDKGEVLFKCNVGSDNFYLIGNDNDNGNYFVDSQFFDVLKQEFNLLGTVSNIENYLSQDNSAKLSDILKGE